MDERRQPQPGDLQAAWDALYEILQPGWITRRPTFDARSRQWSASVVAPTNWHGPPAVVAAAPTEPACIVELARCPVVTLEGGIPR